MEPLNDIHETARAWFLARLVNGAVPEVYQSPSGERVRYFPITLDDSDYWLTEYGLADPPPNE